MKQHKGKIAAGVAGAAVITGLLLSVPTNQPQPLTEAELDSALVHAVELAAEFEGLRLEAYYDQAGFATIGYGHKLSDSVNVDLTQFESISEAQADSLLAIDMATAFECLETYVTVNLEWNQLAALADFVYNEGCGHFEHSTLRAELNAGNRHHVPDQLLRWDIAGGEVNEGLERRREAEIELWEE